MRQKIWSWGDDYIIKDAAGNDRFLVDGKVFTLGDKLSFCDLAGRELVELRQRLLSWGPTYELSRAGGEAATIKKNLWTFFRDRFTVDVTSDGPTPDDLEVQGDFWDHEYAFTRAGQTVAAVSKRWFTWADTYGVDIAAGEDDVLVLACTVVVDLCIEKERRRR
jgi:uncharacterized protein YxjI